MNISYRGRRADGTAVTGRVDVDNLAAWTEQRYRQGWLSLSVHSGKTQVAGIQGPDAWHLVRTWWAG